MPIIATGRDHAVDLVRSLCVLGVIVLHALMVGVTVTAGGPVFENAGESGGWLTPTSWLLQVMPLFFVIGGFAGITALRRGGIDPARFAAARLHRLLRPAIVVVAAVGVLLLALAQAGVPAEIVGIAGYRFGQPLWFLGVFLLCQALLPLLARLHEHRPLLTVFALAALAAAVDVARAVTGLDAVGFLNLAFVWLALQQLGFFLADGRIDALCRRTRALAAVASVGLLAASFISGVHSPDLIANLNPPTTALLLVGVAHTALFSLLRPRIAAFAARPGPAAFTAFVSARTMTVYLWHMPVLLGLAGVLALAAMGSGTTLPEPASAQWWLTRPMWLAAALGLTALLSLSLARIEAHRPRTGTVAGGTVVAASLLALVGVMLLLGAGTSPVTAAIAVLAWLIALRMVRGTRVEIRVAAPARRPVIAAA
ncbi:acyltransferase family protein [Microbacterium sp. Mu-80]|uniref:Acyltransferase family protein n=1 Tax=Microbacterium bandirmense TaxID=3122050 RepID=A0ABU8L6L3_9MICO